MHGVCRGQIKVYFITYSQMLQRYQMTLQLHNLVTQSMDLHPMLLLSAVK